MVGVVALIVSWNTEDAYRAENWERTIATVVDWEHAPRASRHSPIRYIPFVEFEVDGEIITGRLSSTQSLPRRGTEIEIRYDPNDPESVTRYYPDDAFNWRWVFMPLMALGLIWMIEKLSRPPKRE